MWHPAYLLYLAYYVFKTDYRKMVKSMRWVHDNRGKGYLSLLIDIFGSSCKYGTSFMDYFTFRFFNKIVARRNFAGVGVMYRFCSLMNDRRYQRIFRSKALFYQHFGPLMGRKCLYLRDCTQDDFIDWIAKRPHIVVKPNYGALSHGVEFVDTTIGQPADLYSALLHKEQDIIEEPITQHPSLQELNPSSVNTIRVLTVVAKEKVDIIGTNMKLGTGGSRVDNISAGGIGVPIDSVTGILSGPGVSSVIGSSPYLVHPDTGMRFQGFQVPAWDSVLELAQRAARIVPAVRSVGWDIAITEKGAILVEGNDNWGGPLFQFYDDRGFRDVLQCYANV